MNSKMKTLLGGALTSLFLSTISVHAHHSVVAEFGTAEMVEIGGVVEKLFWTDPHIRVRIRVTDGPIPEGETWDAVSHAPGLLARTYGLYPGEIEVGDRLVMVGRPSAFNVNRFSMRNVSINGGPTRQLLRSREQRTTEVAPPPGPQSQ